MVPANTGTEAVEGAIKLARAATGRSRILYAEHAFHGLTLGSLSLNGDENFREGFGPFVPGLRARPVRRSRRAARRARAPLTSPRSSSSRSRARASTSPPEGYLAARAGACREHGTLFVCDEVQTGLGRTGRFFALEHWGLDPDMICVAKALSGGFVPIGGVLVSAAVRDRVFDGMERGVRHGSTFGGNDMAAAAGHRDAARDRARAARRARRRARRAAARAHPAARRSLRDRPRRPRPRADVGDRARRPLGRATARRLERDRARADRARRAAAGRARCSTRHRIFCQVAGHRMNVVKALPALVIEEQEIRRFAAALEDVVADADRMGGAVTRLGWDLARGSARALRGEGARHGRGRLHRLARGRRALDGRRLRACDRFDRPLPAEPSFVTRRPARPRRAAPRARRRRRGLPPRRALQLRAAPTPRRWSASTSRARAR